MDRPANGSWFGEGEIVDADFLVDLLETFRFGKDNVPAGKLRSKSAVKVAPVTEQQDNTTEKRNEEEEDDDGSQGLVGNTSVHESIGLVSFSSDPTVLDNTMSETGSYNEPVSNQETGSHNEPVSNEESGSHNEPVSNEETGSHNQPVSNEESGSHNEPASNEETGSHNQPVSNEESGSHNEPVSNEESGSPNEPVSKEESGCNWLESNSTNLPNGENARHQNVEGETVEEEKDKEEELEDEEKEEKDKDKISERTSSSEAEENTNLEKLLAIQEKYELYCPSCSSCITRKVIIRKKEHGKLVDLYADLKPYESSDIEEIEPPAKAHTPEKLIENNDQEDKDDGYIFACLACLKYYIKLGTRFLQRDYATGKPVDESVEVHLEASKSSNTSEAPPQNKLDRERFTVELLKSTVYGGLTETITSLVVVSSASASGSSTENILALAVANMAGGLIVLAQNLQDLKNNSDQENDRYNELLGRRDNIRMHVLVAVLSYIFFGLIAPLVYAFSFYQTGIKNYKLVSVFSISLVCVIMLGMIKVYVRKPVNVRAMPKPYLKSAAYYTSIVVVSSGVSYIVGEIVGEYIRKLGWFSLYQTGLISAFDGIKPEEFRFTSF